jgi:ATP-dependent helicase/nuclease subunit A
MSITILEKDTDLTFPQFIVLKASAGSGKTYTLTERFVQFILSEKIQKNSLRNILAVTFSNNAAKEMKERILYWLKSVYFGNQKMTEELSRIINLDREKLEEKSGLLVDEILDNYSDFQVKTIDSFMTTVFKASAIDFGYNPEFEILMSIDTLMEYSFDRFLRKVMDNTEEARVLEEIISGIIEQKKGEAAYPWDPSNMLLDKIKEIYRRLSSAGKEPLIENLSSSIASVKKTLKTAIEEIEDAIKKSGLEKRRNSAYFTLLSCVRENRFADIIGKGLTNPPVTKPKKKQPDLLDSYDRIVSMWVQMGELIKEYTSYHVRSYYTPYLRVYRNFYEDIEKIKKQQGKIFIDDINRYLAEYLSSEIVPDVYFRIGETVFHFLIDEFQDTSPIQWHNLNPLIENSLSQGGSLFVVGDTKQAIYGFRNADYTIMKKAERNNPFPSAEHIVRELDTNYRSLQKILNFTEKSFKQIIHGKDEYEKAGERSGLTDYFQKVKEENTSPGYAEVTLCERDNDNPSERLKIQELIQELNKRGFSHGDIAVLTQTNEDAVRVTTWLNEKGIHFISFSNLDIRRRKITGEIISLLNFLDSPTDDLSFATFILGDIFSRILEKDAPGMERELFKTFLFTFRDNPPLYKAFQKKYENLWAKYFAVLFKSAGYFPLYDLITEIFSVFRVFETMGPEEAALVKILDAVKEFEGAGYNSLRDFLSFAADSESDESEWNMDVPKDINAVKVMTIHKAKGLGFPVVIVLLYESWNRGFDYFIDDAAERIRMFKINQKTLVSNPDFESLYREETVRDMVNKLNSLYVGFTRAEQELYVIGVKGGKEGYPFDLLPIDDFSPSVKPERGKVAGPEYRQALHIRHHHRQLKFQIRSDELINIEERQRGEFIHRVLLFVDYIHEEFEKELEQIIRRVMIETQAEYDDSEMKDTILGFLEHKDITGYFQKKADRTVMREQEFSDGSGNLYRMDRVIIDKDNVTVIDFKTGKDSDSGEIYILQLKNYLKILREMYPDKIIEGIIAYIDAREMRRIF